MNVGIVGSGFMGSMHAEILKRSNRATLAGITGKTNKTAGAIAERLGIRLYADYREMIGDTEISVVDICTPTVTHLEIAVDCLSAGKHVILEFPACRTMDEVERLIAESKRNDRSCLVAYYSRYQSQLMFISDMCRTKKIGAIRRAYISRESSRIFSGDDIFNDLMSQDIDFLVRLLGVPEEVVARSVSKNMAALLFSYKDTQAVIEGSTNMHDGYPFTTRHVISGDDGCVDMIWRFTDKPEYTMKYSSADGIEEIKNGDYDPFERELECLIDGLARNSVADMDISSIYETAKITFACRNSIGRQ